MPRLHALAVLVTAVQLLGCQRLSYRGSLNNLKSASRPELNSHEVTSLPLLPVRLLSAIKDFYRLPGCRAIHSKIANAFIASARIRGRTSYVLLRDHFGNTLYGYSPLRGIGGSPNGLQQRAPDHGRFKICSDGPSRETWALPRVLDLFTQVEYTVERLLQLVP
jgi:hypothetical protein